MYYGRKKGLIILIVIISLMLLIVAGVFAFLFVSTDMFKSNDDMFFKYMGKAIDESKFTDNIQLNAIEKLQQQSPYTVQGNVGFKAEGSSLNPSFQNLTKAKIEYDGRVDPNEGQSYVKADLKQNDSNIFTAEYAHSNNIYAIKSDEIVTAYVGIENENLDVLAQKLGYSNLNVPSEFQTPNLTNLLTITEQEKQHITETYVKVMKDNIPSNAFTKENNITNKKDNITYNTTGYRLNLTYDQLKKLEIALLQALKQDSITLNLLRTKAIALGLGSDYTEISNLTSKIDQCISSIQTNTYRGNDVSLIVYVADGDVISIEVIEKNMAKYTFSYTKSDTGVTRNLLIEDFSGDAKYSNIQVSLKDNNTSTNSYVDMVINLGDTDTISFNFLNEGSAAQQYLNTSGELSYSDANGNYYAVDLQQKLEFVDEVTDMVELDRSTIGVLNAYSEDQIVELWGKIVERIKYVANEKLELLGVNFSQENVITPVLNDVIKEQEIQAFNAKFETYSGKVSGTTLITLNNIIKKNNEDTSNKSVVLIVNGINTMGDNKSIESNKTYSVEMKYNDEGYIYEIQALDSDGTPDAATNTTN